jgi:N-acetylglutamate synthase-like GNAT family acetyltransferase
MNNEVSPIKIIPYVSAYQDQIIRLMFNVQSEFNLPMIINDQPDLQEISKFYQTGCGNFWLALADDHVIGTIALIDMDNRQATLRKMFVDKDHRGSEKGVAKSLLNTLLTWCEQKNVSEVYLGTRSIFLAAHKFYEKNGFIEIPKTDLPKSFCTL